MRTVKALRTGFYNGRRRAGDIFPYPGDERLYSWMVEVDQGPQVAERKTLVLPHKGGKNGADKLV